MPNGDRVANGNVHWIRVRQFWIDTALLQKSDDEGFTSRIHGVRRGA
jgi:hypothetical protein